MNAEGQPRAGPAGHLDPQQAPASQPGGNRDKKDHFCLKKNHLHVFGQWLISVRREPWTIGVQKQKERWTCACREEVRVMPGRGSTWQQGWLLLLASCACISVPSLEVLEVKK